MPQLTHNNHGKIQQKRFKIALGVLLIGMSIVLAIWLYWSSKKKEEYRKIDPPTGKTEKKMGI